MNPTVKQLQVAGKYQLNILFSNDETKVFDVSPYLDKGIFKELQDEAYFRRARVAFGAVEWPNAQDFSHDTLYLLGKPLKPD